MLDVSRKDVEEIKDFMGGLMYHYCPNNLQKQITVKLTKKCIQDEPINEICEVMDTIICLIAVITTYMHIKIYYIH